MPSLLIIDLSHWDEAHDYAKVKASGVEGVIYKATQGSGNVDVTYASQRAAAVRNGLLWGAYHFGDGSHVTDQVANFLKHADITAGDLFCLDYEDNAESQMSVGQAREFVELVERQLGRHREGVLYSGNTIKENIREVDYRFWEARRLWLAQYGSRATVPAPWGKYWLWQYTDSATVAGVGNGIDGSHFDGPVDQLKAEWATGKSPQPPIASVSNVTPERICPLCHQPWPIPP